MTIPDLIEFGVDPSLMRIELSIDRLKPTFDAAKRRPGVLGDPFQYGNARFHPWIMGTVAASCNPIAPSHKASALNNHR